MSKRHEAIYGLGESISVLGCIEVSKDNSTTLNTLDLDA